MSDVVASLPVRLFSESFFYQFDLDTGAGEIYHAHPCTFMYAYVSILGRWRNQVTLPPFLSPPLLLSLLSSIRPSFYSFSSLKLHLCSTRCRRDFSQSQAAFAWKFNHTPGRWGERQLPLRHLEFSPTRFTYVRRSVTACKRDGRAAQWSFIHSCLRNSYFCDPVNPFLMYASAPLSSLSVTKWLEECKQSCIRYTSTMSQWNFPIMTHLLSTTCSVYKTCWIMCNTTVYLLIWCINRLSPINQFLPI